jgi:hypothetical protein
MIPIYELPYVILLLLSAALACAQAPARCPDLPALRSTYILNSFNVSLISGVWYEAAFQDLAQVDSSCPTVINTIPSSDSATSDGFTQQFKVNYGPIPFDLKSVYTPANMTGNNIGLYQRTLQSFDLFPLPSVIADVKVDPATGAYTALTDYLCTSVLGMLYVEVRFLFRVPNTSGTDIMAMVERAAALGLKWEALKFTNYSGCPLA